MFDTPLNENTFLSLAMHYYDNSQCINISEFENDLKRFIYLQKLFYRYIEHNDLKEKLIINHLIILYNLWGIITTDFLFFNIDKKYWHILATFLVYLNRMPNEIPELGVSLDELELDQNIQKILKEL